MTAIQRAMAGLFAIVAGASSGCESTKPYDYSQWVAAPPRSILVLPPVNNSVEPAACYGCLSVLTVPLVERGFYVFPVAVVDSMMRENGLPTAADMHDVSLAKLREVFNPDAVLYLTVEEWGTSYEVVQSSTTVTMAGRLIDAETGIELWSGQQSLAAGSGGGGGGLIGMVVSAVVTQVARSIDDPSIDIAGGAAWNMVHDDRVGWLPGPHDRRHAERLGKLRQDAEKSPPEEESVGGDETKD